MNSLSFADPITTSARTRPRRDTFEACRERASEDLLKSVTMLTANERLTLERSAENWSLRADMLEAFPRSAPSPAAREGEDHVRFSGGEGR